RRGGAHRRCRSPLRAPQRPALAEAERARRARQRRYRGRAVARGRLGDGRRPDRGRDRGLGGRADRGAGAMSAGPDGLAVLVHEIRSPIAALAAIAAAYPDADEERRARLRELAEAATASIERLLVEAPTASLRVDRLDAGRLAQDAADTATLSTGYPV